MVGIYEGVPSRYSQDYPVGEDREDAEGPVGKQDMQDVRPAFGLGEHQDQDQEVPYGKGQSALIDQFQ